MPRGKAPKEIAAEQHVLRRFRLSRPGLLFFLFCNSVALNVSLHTVKRGIRYIFLVLGLVSLVLAAALQYTHDPAHEACSSAHEACSSSADDGEHQHPDDCSLCWFVAHQLGESVVLTPLLPEVGSIEQPVIRLGNLISNYKDSFLFQESNKDPPLLV